MTKLYHYSDGIIGFYNMHENMHNVQCFSLESQLLKTTATITYSSIFLTCILQASNCVILQYSTPGTGHARRVRRYRYQ